MEERAEGLKKQITLLFISTARPSS